VPSTQELDRLVDPLGVVSEVRETNPVRGLEDLFLHVANAGSGTAGRGVRRSPAHGSGKHLGDRTLSRVIATAEAAERYAGLTYADEPVWSTAADLPGPTIDLARVPRLSAAELADEACPLSAFDPDARMRWLPGVDLATHEQVWVPAVMACYGLPHVTPAEKFWYRISTGHAVHTDPVKAVIAAITEVVERDVLSVAWLQKLPLPLVDPAYISTGSAELLRWCERHFLQTFVFDATTDLGIPTVYCVQISEHDPKVRHILACATAASITEAAYKALLDILVIRGSYGSDEPLETDFRKFTSLHHGAHYMAHPDRAPAFDFLLAGAALRPRRHRPELPGDSPELLRWLVATLAGKDMQAVAVNRTTRDLDQAGLTAVAMVIPDLQPMSLLPLAQYKAHPRLYTAPTLMGYRSLPEDELNPWPQPFA